MIDYINLGILSFLIKFFGAVFKPFTRKKSPGDKLKCLIVSYLGFNNTGAEVRTYEAIKQIKKAFNNNVYITLHTFNINNTRRYIPEDENIKLTQDSLLCVMKNARLISNQDVFILLEGSTFQNNFSTILFLCYLYGIALAQKLDKLTVAYAVDAGTIEKANQKFARNIINKMNLIMLRNESSIKALQDIGVINKMYVTTDTAFNAESESQEWLNDLFQKNNIDLNRPVIGISPTEFFRWPVKINLLKFLLGVKKDHYYSFCYYTWDKEKKRRSMEFKNNIAKYADWCCNTYNANIILLPMESNDIALSYEIRSLMSHNATVIDPTYNNAKQMTAILRKLNFLVTTRYHGIVLSLNSHVPYIGIAHDGRIKNIMQEMNLYDDYYLSYLDDSLLPKLKEKTIKLNTNIKEVSEHLKLIAPSYINRMNKNIEYFKEAVIQKYGA